MFLALRNIDLVFSPWARNLLEFMHKTLRWLFHTKLKNRSIKIFFLFLTTHIFSTFTDDSSHILHKQHRETPVAAPLTASSSHRETWPISNVSPSTGFFHDLSNKLIPGNNTPHRMMAKWHKLPGKTFYSDLHCFSKLSHSTAHFQQIHLSSSVVWVEKQTDRPSVAYIKLIRGTRTKSPYVILLLCYIKD